ncbi:hypothetical protein TSUD_126470 [Trifolium subterraneum]|uniref:DUF3741 domain-containing protein n=1 Tax=Trifolium subterraneum TaxID=3900 RepID=A0A2Z6M6N9_TRISU|nr:hypothetical protein TSUD_126470 [Trifolium subterraneum]
MCTSKTTTTGCLTAIMRKILCSGNLPKDSSNQITEFDSTNSVLSCNDMASAAAAAVTPPPPIVARLMGLESMGEIPFTSKPGSLSRSKSMNSMDYLGESNGKIQSLHHKRINSTLSFREPPTFQLTENESFFVLNFENEVESIKGLKSKSISNGRKKQMGCSELKQKDEKKIVDLKEKKNKRENVYDEKILIEKGKMNKRVSNKLQEITNTSYKFKSLSEKKCFDSEAVELLKLNSYKEDVIGEKKKRRIRRKKRTNFYAEKKIETECKSDDSSPVSVLEFERKSCGAGIDSIAVGLSSRRKLTPELENNKHILMRSDDNLMIDEKKDKANEGSKKKEMHNYKEYIDIWGEACKLVEDELVIGSKNQVHAWMNQQSGLGSVCADFESEIFDQLLNEVISQLVE